MKRLVAIILILLGAAMLYIGYTRNILPPALTGIGFFAISILLFRKEM
ncbi:hypothetical protein [Robertkochia aurantiaca]|nr:hypothetical protein [Robertkochia sp. 3YJGBD-33]